MLSEQQILDCTDNAKYAMEGCSGGAPSVAFAYIRDNGGLDSEASYPYKAVVADTCLFNPAGVAAEDTGAVQLPAKDEAAMKAALATVGPVAVVIDGSSEEFFGYKTGVFVDSRGECDPERLNHAVLLVGYGTDAESGLDFWLVKNSWGDDWGDGGYIKMVRGKNICGITERAFYPLV